MKPLDQAQSKANDGSHLPRFLRGLFRGREVQLATSETSTTEEDAADVTRLAPHASPVNGEHSPKILVVDDDPVILKTVGIKLAKAGFEVVTGQDGSEAISTARKEHPDVIVLDVFFPPDVAHGGTGAWDGLSVMQWLQRLENGDTPPIIIITGLSTDQIKEKALAAGALAFFQKPIDNDGLIEVINKALEMKRGGKPVKPVDFSI